MKFGHEIIQPLCEELLAFMQRHRFESVSDFKGHSLDYFTTHADLVERQQARKAAQQSMRSDADWSDDEFVRQSQALAL